jgi:hypothetical protein
LNAFTPLWAVVMGPNAGRPRSHSSCTPACVKPASPASKSVLKTVVSAGPGFTQAGRGSGRHTSMLKELTVPVSAVVSSRTRSVHVPWASMPLKYSRRPPTCGVKCRPE